MKSSEYPRCMPCEAPKHDIARQGRRQMQSQSALDLHNTLFKRPLRAFVDAHLAFLLGLLFRNRLCDISDNLLCEVS